MLIRRASEPDIPHILRLVAQLDYDVENEAGEAGARAVLANPACIALLAEDCGQIVGLVGFHVVPQLHHAAPVLTLDELVVDEDARGAGVGTELLAAVVAHARAATAPAPISSTRLTGSSSTGSSWCWNWYTTTKIRA
jgi:N-acetylglutamate synthase-like GNAT family acetyltransferase